MLHLAETVRPRSRLIVMIALVGMLAGVAGLRHMANHRDRAPHRNAWHPNAGQCVNGHWVR